MPFSANFRIVYTPGLTKCTGHKGHIMPHDERSSQTLTFCKRMKFLGLTFLNEKLLPVEVEVREVTQYATKNTFLNLDIWNHVSSPNYF